MNRFVRAVYWMIVGAWLMFECLLMFDKNDGGAMPIAQTLAFIFGIGGLALFFVVRLAINHFLPEEKR